MALCVGNRWFIAFIGDKTHGASESRLLSQPDPKPRHGNGFLLGSTQEGRRWPSEAAVPKGSPLGAVAVPCQGRCLRRGAEARVCMAFVIGNVSGLRP